MPGIFGKHTGTTQHEQETHRLASATVVVGVDGSPGSNNALRWAAQHARLHGRELHIVHGMNLVGATWPAAVPATPSPWVVDAARTHGRDVIARAEELARSVAPEAAVTAEMVSDNPAALLIDRSAAAFTVVVGATGTAGMLAHLGSTLLSVVAHAHGAVVVVRTDPDAADAVHTSGPVVVGVDGSAIGEAAIESAFAEAAQREVELVTVHVWNDANFGHYAGYNTVRLPDGDPAQAEDAIVAERIAGWQEKFPEVRVVRASYAFAPVEHLLEWSKSAQLIILGSRGRGGFAGMLLGSTVNFLVQHAQCPVMVVHP